MTLASERHQRQRGRKSECSACPGGSLPGLACRHFVPNLTIGPPVVKSLRKHAPGRFFDVHLMVDRPEMWVKPFIDGGADSITFHWESLDQSHPGIDASAASSSQKERVLQLSKAIRDQGAKSGLAVKPATGLSEDVLDVLDQGAIDMLLIMTVEPGFGGQSFMEKMMDKVQLARKRYPRLHIQVVSHT